jgi:predicted RNA-binding protein with PUA-like domain
MKYWLFKSDFEDYPLTQFMKDKVTAWEGVRNYQARNFMTVEMNAGDKGIFYHSNAEPAAAVATLEVVSKAKPDMLARNKKSDYYDPKASDQNPIWQCVDVKFVAAFKRPIGIDELRKESSLTAMALLKRGNRLSITPLTQAEYEKICAMGEVESVPPMEEVESVPLKPAREERRRTRPL